MVSRLIKAAIEQGRPLALRPALIWAILGNSDHYNRQQESQKEAVVRQLLKAGAPVEGMDLLHASNNCRIFALLVPHIRDPIDRAVSVKNFGKNRR